MLGSRHYLQRGNFSSLVSLKRAEKNYFLSFLSLKATILGNHLCGNGVFMHATHEKAFRSLPWASSVHSEN